MEDVGFLVFKVRIEWLSDTRVVGGSVALESHSRDWCSLVRWEWVVSRP